MSIKNLVEMIKHNGLLASISQLEELYRVAIDIEQKLADSEARCAALAAENVGLKAAIDATIGWQQSTDPEDVESVRMLVDVKTPATDAFLAEMRAQGVEMFAAVLRRKGDDAFFDAIAEAQANAADQFAAQLRKGVQS